MEDASFLAGLALFCEFQGLFSLLSRSGRYGTILLLLLSLPAAGQDPQPQVSLAFPDSVRIVLENLKTTDGHVIGGGFMTAWEGLTLDQKFKVRVHTAALRRKKFKLASQSIHYYGAMVNAVNVERADAEHMDEFLAAAGRVIAEYPPARATEFFKSIRTFFHEHALRDEKGFRLYAKGDGDYSIDFIDPPKPPEPVPDTAQSYGSWDSWGADTSSDTSFIFKQADEYYLQERPMPELYGPVVKLESSDLVFITPFDSAVLKNTSGTLSLSDHRFVGKGGTFDWSAVSLKSDSVYATLGNYVFDSRRPVLTAQKAKLSIRGLIRSSAEGDFEFRSTSRKDSVSGSFPVFRSYRSNVEYEHLGEGMEFRGGLWLQGRNLSTKALSGRPSQLIVSNSAGRQFQATSPVFDIKDSSLVAANARVTLYHEGDSIFHPGVHLRYYEGKQLLTLERSKGPLSPAPYSASFFKVDFSADILKWSLKSDSLNLYARGDSRADPVIIESVDFYDPEDFVALRGKGFKFHPLTVAVSYCLKNDVRSFYPADLADYAGKTVAEMISAMEFLAQKGMVDFDRATGWVSLREKALHVYQARKGTTDFDNFKVHSYSGYLPNTTINLPKGYMTVRGVNEFNVSDSLNVLVRPNNARVTLLKNRDVRFDGSITAGNFEIYGRDFTMEYDSFIVELNHIDSIQFYTTEVNAYGQSVRKRVNNAMVAADSAINQASSMGGTKRSSGTLFVSRPNNKSGKEKIPTYPRLDATAGGMIYFDRSEVLGGVYDRSIYFMVPPFKLDSLNDADPASIKFEGTFVTGGMLPSFKEKLHTMPDKSLGFEHPIPKEGYRLFQGDGRITGALSMDNSGLRAVGKINYLAATAESKNFIFYPDSVTGSGEKADILMKQFGNVFFPQATLTDYKMRWLPRKDSMIFRNTRDPFSFYNNTAQLSGWLSVSKRGVGASGRLITRGSELVAHTMNFSAKEFSARNAQFEVKTEDPTKPLLTGTDVRLVFNLEKNYADVNPEIEGEAALNFPFAQFKTSIPNARWDLNSQKIFMSKSPDVELENSYFYTTREDLDSLNFNAEKAEYDIKTKQLKVSGIPYIIVADAKITPQGGEVLVLENARIGQLKNTTIVIDTLDGYHRLAEGVVDIISRKEFTGYATYQYVNPLGDTFAIKMTDFHLVPVEGQAVTSRRTQGPLRQQTIATGSVDENARLVLAPRLYYKGEMIMFATKPALQLQGAVRLDLKKVKNYNTWIRYEQSGDEKEVYIHFDNALTEDGRKVDAGLHYGMDNSLYASFLTDKKSEEDEDFFLPSGWLFYDTASREFKIIDRDKEAGLKLSGKVFAYNEETQGVKFEGPVTFFRASRDFSLTASALGSGNLESDEVKMSALVGVTMNLPPAALDLMAQDILAVLKEETLPEGRGDETELLYKIADIVGEKAVKEYEQRSLQGYLSLSTLNPLALPLLFSNVNLKWSGKAKAFYNDGPLGLSNILRNDVNAALEGFMEICKSEDGLPVFHVFFKASADSWYYFGYEDNRLLVHSSNPAVNSAIAKKSNAGKAKMGELVFVPGSDEETLDFINRFRQQYYGQEVPYELNSAGVGKGKKKATEEDDGF
jgi:hypothetical protein